jgi:hypothetical protein
VRAEKLAIGPQDRASSIATAQTQLNDAIRVPEGAAA